MEHPNPVKPARFPGGLVYLKLFFTPFTLLRHLLRRNVVVHITPLSRTLIYPGVFCSVFARMLGKKVIVDIRAGAFIRFYEGRGKIYSKAVDLMLKSAAAIAVEGQPYVEYVRRITKGSKPVLYFPNTIPESMVKAPGDAPETATTPDPRRFNIFYFGRITGNKGIDVMVETLKLLPDDFQLYLAGTIAPDVDKEKLRHDRIHYLGILTLDELASAMNRMGFFIFPSVHSGEGQSNSLIESMGKGLIPISSDNGFSAEVVGDAGFILPKDATATDYASAIQSLTDDDFRRLRSKAQQRIYTNHNLGKEITKLVALYNRILSNDTDT